MKIIRNVLLAIGLAVGMAIATKAADDHCTIKSSGFGSNSELPSGTHYWDNNGVNGFIDIYKSLYNTNSAQWYWPGWYIYKALGAGAWGPGTDVLYDTRASGEDRYLVVWKNQSGTAQTVTNSPQAPFYVYQYDGSTCYKAVPQFPSGAPCWAVWLVEVNQYRADELTCLLLDYGYNGSFPPDAGSYNLYAN